MQCLKEPVSRTYNGLPEVFQANRDLVGYGRDGAVNPLLSIIRRYDMEKHVGVRLLHKHNEIFDDELMVEDAVTDSHGFSLVTQARLISDLDDDVVPNSWILTDAGFVPLEFSRKHLLRDPNFGPGKYPEMFRDIANKLRELGLSNTLGVAVTPSEFVERQHPASSSRMLETTALDDRANVLRFVDVDDDLLGQIETFWTTSSESTGPGEPSEPGKEKPTPTIGCSRYCPYVQDPPVHQGTYIHEPTKK